MKKIYLCYYLFGSLISASAQTSESPVQKDFRFTPEFLRFEIPSIINGSNLDPSPISNASANFAENKVSLKLGVPALFRSAADNDNFWNTGFIQGNFKANNGVSTLYKTDNPPLEYGVSGGYSRIISRYHYLLVDAAGNVTNDTSSQAVNWISIKGGLDQAKYNLITPTAGYGNMNSQRNDLLGNVFISFNRYYHSDLNFLNRLGRGIWSAGLGYAKTNNYNTLNERTLQDGALIYNADTTAYQTVVESKSGVIGKLETFEGITVFGEYFIPLVRRARGGFYFGNRVTFYAVNTKKNIANGNSGFYVNLKEKGGNDVFSFSLIAQFNQFNRIEQSDYFDKYFSVVLQAAVPLRFN
ncbi:hypothetical protein CNR22_24240 [Sphingobacteriaceae bacterium]|nr:hypothetical protein CNR22_24240 [Sphingobacteriaceae bacterium]